MLHAKPEYRWAADEVVVLPQLGWIKVCKLDCITPSQNAVSGPHLLDSWARVVGFAFLETDRIYHDSAFHVSSGYFSLIVIVECSS